MIKAAMTKDDGTSLVVFGLSHRNLQGLKTLNAIIIDMRELGHRGTMVLNACEGKCGELPGRPGVAVLNFTDNTLEALRGGHMLVINMEGGHYTGEILVFSGETELVMQKMMGDFDVGRLTGSICEKCGCGRRDDGSCDCKETMT